MIQLESLANELLLDLFEFLGTGHLLRAFFGLNYRFDQLLYSHFRTHQLNFQSISKEDFDVVCLQHLSFIIDQVRSLCLSNEETPNLSELLLSRGVTLDRFIHLQSLSLHCIHSLDTLIKITYQCRHIPYLTYLNISSCDDEERHRDILNLLNNIWSIPTLTYANLNGIQTKETWFSKISAVSSSIEHLSIENIACDMYCLSHLFECTPRLQRLCSTVYSYSTNNSLTVDIPSVKSLKLSFGGSYDTMKNLFEKLPNLYHLTIKTSQLYLNGYKWEQILTEYLPKIEIFQLKMEFEFRENNHDMEENINELLTTFQTRFWLEKHQWFVRCHWDPSDPYKWITLYTLPYAFDTFHYSNKYFTKSTCLDEGEYWSYDHVNILGHGDVENSLSDNFSLFHARFPSLRRLDINLSLDEKFWSCVPSLCNLTSLHVSLYKQSSYCQLQTLLDQAPRLYSLKFESPKGLHTGLFKLTSKSIRRLDVIVQFDRLNSFTKEDCASLIKSPLGVQCEVLLIRLKNQTTALDLIQKMSNLRLLIFTPEDDEDIFRNFSFSSDELIQWLEYHFSSTYSIIRDQENRFCIQVWINRKAKTTFSSDDCTLTSNYRNKLSQFLTSFQQLFS